MNRLAHLTSDEGRALAEFVKKLRQNLDGLVVSAILFGSRARGEGQADSDLDVLVVVSDEDPQVRKEVRSLAAEVWLEHGLYLSTRVWSLAHWHRLQELQTLLYQNICKDGVELLSPVTMAEKV
jgi:predicted nucleotidyltransferase